MKLISEMILAHNSYLKSPSANLLRSATPILWLAWDIGAQKRFQWQKRVEGSTNTALRAATFIYEQSIIKIGFFFFEEHVIFQPPKPFFERYHSLCTSSHQSNRKSALSIVILDNDRVKKCNTANL